MSEIKTIIPVLRVTDLARAHRFYVESLGFTEPWGWPDPPQYGGVQAKAGELAAIHLTVEAESKPGEIYILVDDVDGLFERVSTTDAEIIFPVGDRPYGMRDFMVADPDGNKISFGSDIARSEPETPD